MDLRLKSPTLDFHVDVRVRSFGGRWLAVAAIGGDSELGLGLTPRQALAGALSALGDQAASELLADLHLTGGLEAE